MELLIYFFIYFVLAVLLGMEGQKRTIGGMNAFLLSFFFTPIVGFVVVYSFRRKIIFHHFIKIGYKGSIKEPSIKNTLHKSGSDDWVKIKTSEFRIV